MQILAQSLLVLRITHNSSLALGTVALAQALSFFIFALVGGSIADRIDKRRLLLFTQTLSMLLAFLLGICPLPWSPALLMKLACLSLAQNSLPKMSNSPLYVLVH